MKIANKNLDSLKIISTRPNNLHLFSTGSLNEQQCLSSDSPDSGKGKEISSESISDPFLPILSQQHNSTKTFSITEDLTTQSISINDTQQHISAYGSTSPSLTSSSRSSINSIKTKNTNDNYLYHQIPTINHSSSFTNSAFTQSPLRTVTKEFDPLIKSI